MDRVIIDTNLWISFLLTKDYFKLDLIINEHALVLLFSEELLAEFLEVAARPKFQKYFSFPDLQELLRRIDEHAEFITITSTAAECRDEKDNFLLALAADGGATHLITGDKDLLDLRTYGKTKILTIASYLSGREG